MLLYSHDDCNDDCTDDIIIPCPPKVIAAEGEHKASRALRHAAEVICDSPAALQVIVIMMVVVVVKMVVVMVVKVKVKMKMIVTHCSCSGERICDSGHVVLSTSSEIWLPQKKRKPCE